MSSLRVISLTILADSIYNILIFFAEKMWVAFAKATHIFFSKKFQHICVSLDVNFNESLTNDIVSFEQLGPGIWQIHLLQFVNIYLHAQTCQNIPSGLKVKAIFTNWFRTDGHASTRAFMKKSCIWQFHCLDLVKMYLHAKHYQNTLLSLKVRAILTDWS